MALNVYIRKRNRKRQLLALAFLLPALALIAFALYAPFIWNGILSFQKWNGFSDSTWIGLDNYSRALTDNTSQLSILHSLYLGLVSTAGAVILGIFLAALVFKVYRKEGAFYRLIMFMPVMLPAAVIGLLFTFIFNSEMGMLNNFLRMIGLSDITRAWLEDRNTVLGCIAFVSIWKMCGLTMILTFAGMKMLPKHIFESSKLEGASYIRQFFSLILPLIRPTILIAVVYTLATNFKSYDVVKIMTGGGPGIMSSVVPINIMKAAFKFGDFGYAAAQAVILTGMVILIVLIVRRVLKGETYEY